MEAVDQQGELTNVDALQGPVRGGEVRVEEFQVFAYASGLLFKLVEVGGNFWPPVNGLVFAPHVALALHFAQFVVEVLNITAGT